MMEEQESSPQGEQRAAEDTEKFGIQFKDKKKRVWDVGSKEPTLRKLREVGGTLKH